MRRAQPSKVGKLDGEGTFAGTRGNDKVALIADPENDRRRSHNRFPRRSCPARISAMPAFSCSGAKLTFDTVEGPPKPAKSMTPLKSIKRMIYPLAPARILAVVFLLKDRLDPLLTPYLISSSARSLQKSSIPIGKVHVYR